MTVLYWTDELEWIELPPMPFEHSPREAAAEGAKLELAVEARRLGLKEPYNLTRQALGPFQCVANQQHLSLVFQPIHASSARRLRVVLRADGQAPLVRELEY